MEIREVRRRLEVQGFLGLRDEELSAVRPWMRFTPALNTAVTAGATLLASPVLCLAVAAIMAPGAITRWHPFDVLFNQVVRRLIAAPPLPPSGPRRRLIFGLAAVWMALTAWAFGTGAMVLGYVLGLLMAVLAGVLAIVQVCVVSEMLARLFGMPSSPEGGEAESSG